MKKTICLRALKAGLMALLLMGHLPTSFASSRITYENTPKAIKARIESPAVVETQAGRVEEAVEEVALGPGAGKKRYEASCALCHLQGVAGAPKLGDKAAWKPRIDKGMEALLKTAISGIGGMPPRGTCMSCSDEELRVTIEYMVDQSK